jgi:peptidoglycan hydrolase FlgJ
MVNTDLAVASIGTPAPQPTAERKAQILEQAREFESVFVAQMLKYSGLEKAISSQGGFGGEAYSSLLLEQYASKIVEKGGFGLTENIYEQLLKKEGLNETDTAA